VIALPLVASGGSDSDGPAPLTQVALLAWEGAADAGCAVATSVVAIECASAHRISGDPHACPGFAATGTGAPGYCEGVCESTACHLSGLSDGSSAVVCGSGCSAFGEH
jgi:hypothetical protein